MWITEEIYTIQDNGVTLAFRPRQKKPLHFTAYFVQILVEIVYVSVYLR